MKRDKFKKMKLEIHTLEPVRHPDNCVLIWSGLQLEVPEQMNLSVGEADQKMLELEDGTVEIGLDARGIRTDDRRMKHLRTGKQAELLDYHYFRSRLSQTVVTEVQAELFDFHRSEDVPFTVKKLEFVFGNGKKVDYTDKVSVLSLSRLAS